MRRDIRTDLVKKIISGEASHHEIRRFNNYIDSLNSEEYSQFLDEYEDLLSQYSFVDKPDLQSWQAIRNRINTPRFRLKQRVWVGIAASMLLVSSFFLYLHREKFFNLQLNQAQTAQVAITPGDITHGANRALLKLHDGSELDLNDVAGTALHSGLVIRTKDGSLSYQVEDPQVIPGTNSYNTLETPKGGQYKLLLPDGTSVWLNASSTIKFPIEFAGTERKVELSGEAYFEVAPDKAKPFIVSTPVEEVTVLGTHFNVRSYPDEISRTTLVEGRVKVSMTEAKGRAASSAILQPGQQSYIRQNRIVVQRATVEDAIAWKNGNFMFNDEEITSVMRNLARWYDVEIVYLDPVQDIKIWGSLSRFTHISEVLQVIELTKLVKFKIEGRRVYVMKA